MHVELTTRRLRLRPLGSGDQDAVHAYASDPQTARYLLRLPHKSPEETAAFLAGAQAEWAKERPAFYEFAVELEGRLIGHVSLYLQADGRSGELGWVLDRAYWGHGYATEAAGALLRFAAGALGLRRLTAHRDAENLASARVMEKLGLRLAEEGERLYPDGRGRARELLYTYEARDHP